MIDGTEKPKIQVHERSENYGGIGLKPPYCSQSLKKDPTFQERYNYQWEHFCNSIQLYHVMCRFWIHPVFRP